MSPSDNRVLMIVRDDSRFQDLMIEEEVLVMKDMVQSAGHVVDVVTVNDEALTGATTLTPDLAVAEVDMFDYDGLLLPCMAPVPDPAVTMPDRILPLIRQAKQLGLAIGAMRGSVRELGRAGALSGHRYSAAGDLELADAEFVGVGVTTDDNLVTAGSCPAVAKYRGGPDETAELTTAFLDILSARA